MDALRFASEASVRAILIAVCDDDGVRKKALQYLSMLEPTAVVAFKKNPNAKRKASSGLSICVQCEEAFDEGDNKAKDCRYHPGVMTPDYDSDFWADHDEDCHGIIDSDFCRNEYPEGFQWTCCEKLGTEGGCKAGVHQSSPELSKKGKQH